MYFGSDADLERSVKKVVGCILGLFIATAHAEDISFLSSDMTRYKSDGITCSGNVVIVYFDRVISADEIVYDRKNQTITARGGVIIKDKQHNVLFADEISVSQDFQYGSVKNIKIIMEDKSRLAAVTGAIKKGKYYLNNVIYSPCYECNSYGEITWQIKAQHVIFDPNGDVKYRNVQFDVLGTTITAIPYFSHTNYKIKRKSGILPPQIATSSSNGLMLTMPYLWAISNSQEVIFKPLITTKAGGIVWGEYGLRFPHGELHVDTSITDTRSVDGVKESTEISQKKINKIKNNGYRGHFFAKLNYEINDTWRAGSDIKLVSDQYYLKRFTFLPYQDRTLETNVRLEGFCGDNYTLLRLAKFQTENYDNIPVVLPIFERNYYRDMLGGTATIDIMGMCSDFNNSRSAQKITTNASWGKEILLPLGQLLQLNGVLSFRTLRVDEREHSQYNSECSIVPQISCFWNWPLIVTSNELKTIITPIVGAIIASNSKFQDIFEYPFSELNALNLFTGNRSISAYDIDSGQRICYGVRVAGYYRGQNIGQFIIGQSSELTDPPKQTESSGLKYKNSNTLFGLDIFLAKNLTWISRGSYCHHTRHWSRIETGLDVQYKKYDCNIMIFNGKHCFYNPFDDSIYNQKGNTKTPYKGQEIKKYKGMSLDIGYQTTPRLKLLAGIVVGNRAHNDPKTEQKDNGQCRLIRQKIGMIFKNECTEIRGEIAINRFRSGDLKPETALKLAIHLKNLGI